MDILVAIEGIMELWLRNTPKFMQPRLFWTAYFAMIDRFYLGRR
jgi:hypothetical protein